MWQWCSSRCTQGARWRGTRWDQGKHKKTFSLLFFCIQVVRFVSTLSKLKAKGRDWKSTLLSEVASSNLSLTFSITVISLITVTIQSREPGRSRAREVPRVEHPSSTERNIQRSKTRSPRYNSRRQMELKTQRSLEPKKHRWRSRERNSHKKYRLCCWKI